MNMKKALSVLLILCFAVCTLTACFDEGSSETTGVVTDIITEKETEITENDTDATDGTTNEESSADASSSADDSEPSFDTQSDIKTEQSTQSPTEDTTPADDIATRHPMDTEFSDNSTFTPALTGEPEDVTTLPDISEETIYLPNENVDVPLKEEFVILTNTDGGDWDNRDFFEDSESTDPVRNAVYKRKKLIDAEFDVSIKVIEGVKNMNISRLVAVSAIAGANEYDIVVSTAQTMYSLAIEKYLVNTDNIMSMDTSSDVWDQWMISQTTLQDKNFFVTGDITTADEDSLWVMMYNQSLAKSVGIDENEISGLVKSGKWTLDKLLQYCKSFAYTDLDKDNAVSPKDRFAIATTDRIMGALYFGAGRRIAVNGVHGLNLQGSSEHDTVLDKIAEIYVPSYRYTFDSRNHSTDTSLSRQMFNEDRSLFFSDTLKDYKHFKNKSGVVVIPMPKADESQEQYASLYDSQASMFAGVVKMPNNRVERSGAVMQSLAEEGKKLLTPAYYGQFDKQSLEMMDHIMENRVFDFGYNVNIGNTSSIYHGITELIRSNNTKDYSHTFSRLHHTVTAALDDLEKSIYYTQQ